MLPAPPKGRIEFHHRRPQDWLPYMKAISIKPHWAWLIVNGHKDIENRTWRTHHRGKVLIHASSHKITKAEYEDFVECCKAAKIKNYPAIGEFKTSGIIGSVEISDCVEKSKSFWFNSGGFGFVLANAKKLSFKAMKGKLNIWAVKP